VKARIATLAAVSVFAIVVAAGAWRFLGERANAVVTEHAEAELVAARDAAAPGEPLVDPATVGARAARELRL